MKRFASLLGYETETVVLFQVLEFYMYVALKNEESYHQMPSACHMLIH